MSLVLWQPQSLPVFHFSFCHAIPLRISSNVH
jgi:hypothetical protein